MDEDAITPQPEVKIIRLRRPNFNQSPPDNDSINTSPLSDKIQKNLEPLRENVKKKMFAQSLFYRRNPQGTSPLMRNSKGPVRQRLGNKIQLRRLTFAGTSTSSVPPKMRQIRPIRTNIAQLRLNRIRQTQQQNHSLGLITPSAMRKSVRLRRTLPNSLFTQPTNLTVQVKNNNFQELAHHKTRRFKMMFDPKLQAEIRDLQRRHISRPQIVDDTPMHVMSTNILLHDRFGSY